MPKPFWIIFLMVAVMIRLSVDILWSTRLLLKRIIEYKLNCVDDIYLPNISSTNLEVLLELAETCHWISMTGSQIRIENSAEELLGKTEFTDQARKMLADYIKNVNPAWAKRIPYGRRESFIFMNKDEQACFYEAGLMNENPNNSEIEWWDHIANYIRSQDDLHRNETGRKGELYTILYENNRTNEKSQWISVDSNLAGYDIISCVAKDNKTRLLIEVKCSDMSISNADFYITAHEWHTACNSNNYLFYLWCLYDNRKQLAIIEPNTILPYIPTNNETGKWQMVKIPFNSFKQMFTEIA